MLLGLDTMQLYAVRETKFIYYTAVALQQKINRAERSFDFKDCLEVSRLNNG